MVYLARRNPVVPREDWPKRWLKHARVGSIPELLAELSRTYYCLVQPAGEALPRASEEYDGVALLWPHGLHSVPLITQLLESKELTLADELRVFSTFVKDFTMFCVEDVLRDGPDTDVGVIQFVRRQPDIGPTPFLEQWRARWTAELADPGRLPGLSRCVLNPVIALPPPGYRFDGVAELWFDSREAVAAAAEDLDRVAAESADIIDRRGGVTVLTTKILSWSADPAPTGRGEG